MKYMDQFVNHSVNLVFIGQQSDYKQLSLTGSGQRVVSCQYQQLYPQMPGASEGYVKRGWWVG